MGGRASQRPRLMIDVTPALRRRVKVAAAQRDLTIREYVVSILETALADEMSPSPAARGRLVTKEMVAHFKQVQAEQGAPLSDDSADLINEAREERTAGL